MLGMDMDYLPDWLRERDQRLHLSMGNLIHLTPPKWVHLGGFHLARRMVTNGEYAQFLQCTVEAGEGNRVSFYDAPDVWRYVWNQLAFMIDTVRVTFDLGEGEIETYEEAYADAQSFVEAYISSLRQEIDREMQKKIVAPKVGREGHERRERLFVAVRYLLRWSICQSEYEVSQRFTDQDWKRWQYYAGQDGPQKLLADLGFLCELLRESFGQFIDPRFRQLFQRGQHKMDVLCFLERLRTEVRQLSSLDEPIPLSRVLYPRGWTSPQGDLGRVRLVGRGVPWSELPVTHLSFYEALAYCVWLWQMTGLYVALPNEAQYERAASWPQGRGIDRRQPLVVDPRNKLVFPWQDHNQNDFNFHFGREGAQIKQAFEVDRVKYQKLLEDTSRHLEDGTALYMLEGFGWHWTGDRYNENEQFFNRFELPAYPRFQEVPVTLKDAAPSAGATTPRLAVYEYQPFNDRAASYFVLKGSPEVLGGPGMTIRRYAAYPLRGYPDVGFRYVVGE